MNLRHILNADRTHSIQFIGFAFFSQFIHQIHTKVISTQNTLIPLIYSFVFGWWLPQVLVQRQNLNFRRLQCDTFR